MGISGAAGRIALVALVAACDGREPSLLIPGLADGTRLRARVWDGGDGARSFRTWFDTELGVECQFTPATDGRYRCLPSRSNVFFLDDAVYSDAACTRRAVVVPDCEARPAYVFGPPRATAVCADLEAVPVLAVGARRGSPRLYRQLDTGCFAEDAAAGFQVYDVGDELPPATFVPAELRAREGTSRVAPYVFEAEDGAQEAVSSWDRERGWECARIGSEDSLRCGPVEVALHYDWIWADAACSVQAAVDLASIRPCAQARVIGGGGELLEVGAEVPRSEVFTTNDPQGTCTPLVPTIEDSFYLEGPPMALASLPTLQRVLDGTGRLRAERYTDEAGASLAAAIGFHDTESDQACWMASFIDGLRCLPAAGYSTLGPLFADPACTIPLAPWSGDAAPLVALQYHTAENACDLVAYEAAYAILAPFTGSTVYIAQPEGCVASPSEPLATYYTIGEPVDLPLIVQR